VGKPNFGRVTLAIQLGGFHGSHGHSTAENGNGSCLCQRIFNDQPSANAKKGGKSQDNQEASDTSK
jgi:hypothetical protein